MRLISSGLSIPLLEVPTKKMLSVWYTSRGTISWSPPFSQTTALKRNIQGELSILPLLHVANIQGSVLSVDALEFAESLLHLDGSKRPSATDALKHHYFQSAPCAVRPDLKSLKDDFHEYEQRQH